MIKKIKEKVDGLVELSQVDKEIIRLENEIYESEVLNRKKRLVLDVMKNKELKLVKKLLELQELE